MPVQPGLFTRSVLGLDPRGDALKLRKQAERWEKATHGLTEREMHCRLFSLYAWEAEAAAAIGGGYVEARRKMKSLDKDLFAHYMESRRNR